MTPQFILLPGLELIGLTNPRGTQEIKKLIAYVEIDRCATDAISYVTGVKLGRRSLKFKDYGIMAATVVNLSTQLSGLSPRNLQGKVPMPLPPIGKIYKKSLQNT